MGKRKSKARVITKKRPAVDKIFNCLFCDHKESVEVKINKNDGTGNLRCRVCGVSASYPTNSLSAPVDVYCDWLDEAERLNKDTSDGKSGQDNKFANARREAAGEEDEEEEEEEE